MPLGRPAGGSGYTNGSTDEGAAFVWHGSASGVSTGAPAWGVEGGHYGAHMHCIPEGETYHSHNLFTWPRSTDELEQLLLRRTRALEEILGEEDPDSWIAERCSEALGIPVEPLECKRCGGSGGGPEPALKCPDCTPRFKQVGCDE